MASPTASLSLPPLSQQSIERSSISRGSSIERSSDCFAELDSAGPHVLLNWPGLAAPSSAGTAIQPDAANHG